MSEHVRTLCFAYVANDPVNATDPTGMEILEDGKLKVTVSLGGSGTVAAPTSGSPGANAGGDAVAELGISFNNPDAIIPSDNMTVNAVGALPGVGAMVALGKMTSVDEVGIQTADGIQGDTGSLGIIADLDLAEVGISLGTISDREGTTFTAEGDYGPVGGEAFSGGDLAGSGVRLSLFGPGAGAAVSKSETNTITRSGPLNREEDR